MIADLISIIFPETCLHCKTSLLSYEKFICTSCKTKLPYTNDHKNKENDLLKKFAFEQKVISASSFLYFRQGGISQKLIHKLKYNNRKEIGKMLGNWLGKKLNGRIQPTMIIPVPIHKRKERKRGYNQSTLIANGIAEAMDQIPVRVDIASRTIQTDTQTKKSQIQRWENVQNIYSPIAEDLSNESTLVVDDVITTGATVGMLCQQLAAAKVKSIHIACIARAE